MLPPECEAALAQLDAFRRGELPADELESMQQHLAECRRCLAHKHHEDAFLQRLAKITRDGCPEPLRITITQLIAKETRAS